MKSKSTVFIMYMIIVMGVITGITSAQQPVYQGTLVADSTANPGEIHCAWDAPQESVDSIRIWIDDDTIPLEYDINLPLNQAHYVSPATMTTDTLRGLQVDTYYFLGLQICKNTMWSYVT